MGKNPAVLWYSSDFLSGIMLLTHEQVGQYAILLSQQHQLYPEHFPENHMINICGSLDSPVIKKFKRDKNGLYYNERMEDECIKRINYCNSRSNNKSGRKSKKSYDKSYDNHMDTHMGNDNDNENKDKNVIEIPDHLKEIWPDFLKMRKLIKKPATERAQKNIISKLYKITNIASVQVEILEQSIDNDWQDVYPLRDKNRKQYGKQEITREQIIDQMNRLDLS